MNGMKNLDELRRFLKLEGFALNASVADEWWESTEGTRTLRVTISDEICIYQLGNSMLEYQVTGLNHDSVPVSLIKSIIRKALILA